MAGIAARGRRDLIATLSVPANLIALGLLAVAFVVLFRNWFLTQHAHSWGNGDWSHAYMVPFISLYLLWQERKALERAPVMVFWPGVMVMLMGVWTYVYFIVAVPNHLGQGLAGILTLFGMVVLLLGPAIARLSILPIGYLIFCITMPEQVMIKLTFRLQQLAAHGSWIALNSLGVKTDLAGSVLSVLKPDNTMHPLNVAEQCSGMRMVIAFVALGTAVAIVGVRTWWKRVVLLALAVPIALLLNIARVVTLGAASLWESDLAAGDAHTFIGTVLLVPGFVLYMLVLVALNKAVPEPSDELSAGSGAGKVATKTGAVA